MMLLCSDENEDGKKEKDDAFFFLSVTQVQVKGSTPVGSTRIFLLIPV